MESKPNIIFILADDMGYGDMTCNNPDSKIPTPNLDRLAEQGMRFTNAHAASSLCTPSRYNVLTGRYSWRSKLKKGIVWEWDSPVLESGRLTVAGLLKQQGYATHCIGKWHLGWEWMTIDGRRAGDLIPFASKNHHEERRELSKHIDYGQRIGGGPVDHGFDSYFGVDVPNFPPYAWFEDDHLVDVPTVEKSDDRYGNPGMMCEGWSWEAMIPTFTQRAVSLIENEQTPFFLYFPLTSPHTPIVPNEPFQGKSGAGRYGDFVCEVDWIVGEIMDALERTGKVENTLLVFTSDNGPEGNAYPIARKYGHFCMGHWRGTKSDLWEGGHREPFIASWPNTIPCGTVCDQLVCLGDLMATCADITKTHIPDDARVDSISMLPLLSGNVETPTRENLILHSGWCGNFALISGDWVFIDAPSGGDCFNTTEPGNRKEPEWFRKLRGYSFHDCPGELFDLSSDEGEKNNLYAERPEIVREMQACLVQARSSAREAPRELN